MRNSLTHRTVGRYEQGLENPVQTVFPSLVLRCCPFLSLCLGPVASTMQETYSNPQALLAAFDLQKD
jgi:hypothetical protein